MSDLTVVAVLKANAGSEATLREGLSSLVGPTLEEPGCISYDLFQSAGDPTTFITVEKWKSQADIDAHMQSAHIASALGSIGPVLDGAPAIHVLSPVS